MIDNGHIPVAPTPQIGSLLVACCRTIGSAVSQGLTKILSIEKCIIF